MIDQLIHIITREAQLFEAFLDLLKQQQQVLVQNDIEGINRITELQQEKLRESRQLNSERERIVAEIGSANALEGDLTVSRLLKIANADEAARLEQLQQLVMSLHEQINSTRNSNALLLNQSREFVANTMSMLGRIHAPSSSYSSAGKETTEQEAIIMDRRA